MSSELLHDDGDAVVGAACAGVEAGAVFAATQEPHSWEEVEERLVLAWHLTRSAFTEAVPVVYVVRSEDLLGQRSPLAAAAAAALVGGARTAAIEGRRAGIGVNVVAIDADTEADRLGGAIAWLLGSAGVTGQVLNLGPTGAGKVPA